MLNWIAGIIIFFGMLVFTIGQSAGSVVDIPSIIIVIVGTCALVLMAFTPFEIFTIKMQTIFGKEMEPALYRRAKDFWALSACSAVIVGGLGSILGFILLLQNLSDPNSIGPCIAVALLTLLYGIFLAGLSLAGYYKCRRKGEIIDTDADDSDGDLL